MALIVSEKLSRIGLNSRLYYALPGLAHTVRDIIQCFSPVASSALKNETGYSFLSTPEKKEGNLAQGHRRWRAVILRNAKEPLPKASIHEPVQKAHIAIAMMSVFVEMKRDLTVLFI